MPYIPNPIDTSNIMLPASLNELMESLAENTHEVWARQRIAQGWTYGEQRDDARKLHPDIVPYDELPEGEKDLDRQTAMEALKAIVSLGYVISKP